MPQINIFVDKDGRNEFVAKIDRDLAIKHSKTIASLLETDPDKIDIVIKHASKGAVDQVIGFIKNGRRPLRIGISHEPFARGIAIHQAVRALDIIPPQAQVESHIVYVITQHKITAGQVEVIQRASSRPGMERIYEKMVHGVGYYVRHDKYTAKEKKDIKDFAVKYPTLDVAIGEKIKDLKERTEKHEQMMRNREEAAARRARAAEREESY